MIDAKDYATSVTQLKALASTNPDEPRIYYSLGRVYGLQAAGTNDPDGQERMLVYAKDAYTNVLNHASPNTDKALLSLAYVALARIYEHFERNDVAIQLYDGAIKVGDVAGSAFAEAIAGKQRLLKANPQ
jgi:hypothetical protein